MTSVTGSRHMRLLIAALAIIMVLGACSRSRDSTPATTTGDNAATSTAERSTEPSTPQPQPEDSSAASTAERPAEPPTPQSQPEDEDFPDLPSAARVASGGGDPRPTGYWALWNSCAPDNRAEVARANGGRAAGWVLLDDILADPGIQLGDHLLVSCEEGLSLLQQRNGDPFLGLAAQMLAAELNLNVGAETCAAVENALLSSHLVLSSAGFDGRGASKSAGDAGGALAPLIEQLTAYNAGRLCR